MDESNGRRKLISESLARAITERLTNRQFLFIASIIVAIWAGLIAVLLKGVVHFLQVGIQSLSIKYHWIYFVAPAFGVLLTVLFVKFFLKGKLEAGNWHVMLAIAKKSSRMPASETYSHAVTSALTVGMGGSAGIESPIVQTGSAIGSTFASLFPMNYRDRTLLLACGAAAGIAAAFNAPITGVLFALEVMLVDVHVTSFIPLLIAGAVGALCSKIILHEEIILSFTSVKAFDYHNVPFYVALGILCGIVSVFYVRSLLRTHELLVRRFESPWLRWLCGSVLLGAMILLFPALFGEGYATVKNLSAMEPQKLFVTGPMAEQIVASPLILSAAVLVLALVKVFAVAFTTGSGGNGGNFAPSLFVGACLGFAFANVLIQFGFDRVTVANFCLVGMAGVLTGVFHSPLTAIFLIAEVTGGYGLMIPLMIVAALSSGASRFLRQRSLDETILRKVVKNFSFDKDAQLLSRLSLGDFIETDFVKVKLGSTLRELVDLIAHSKRNIFPVVDERGQLNGVIALEDIREIMFNTALYDSVKVDQLMRPPVVCATIGDEMPDVMEMFDKSAVWNIPVVDNGTYLGFISKSSIFSVYRKRLKNY